MVLGVARPCPRARAGQRVLETQIAEAEQELSAVKALLLDPATFDDPERGAEVGREHDRLSGALAELYDRWAAAERTPS